MSDLREALEKFADDAEALGLGRNITVGELRELLADHPAEPAPVASRERVEQVVRRVYLDGGASIPVAQEGAADIVDALLAAGVFRSEAARRAGAGEVP